MNQTQSRFAIALKDHPLLVGIEKIKGADFFYCRESLAMRQEFSKVRR
jgi:hypothetical protein